MLGYIYNLFNDEDVFVTMTFVCIMILALGFVLRTSAINNGGHRRRDKGADSDWWQEIRLAEHRRLVIPPTAYIRRNASSSSSSIRVTATTSPATPSALFSRAKTLLTKNPYGLVDAEEDFCGTLLPQNIPSDCIPLLCFVNTKSGGKKGAFVLRELRDYLSDVQVVDLHKTNPMNSLKLFSILPQFRVLVCGGDGSVRWILNCIKQLPEAKRPAVGIMPLGTGNDLAR